jgi:hypothetical protein
MDRKGKGARRERQSMALLEAEGYKCTKSGASLGAWDIIGVGRFDIVLLQVKSNRPPGRREMKVLQEFKAPSCCTKLLHIWRDGQGTPEVKAIS